MPRIPDTEIDRIKSETDLVALIRSRGIELKKHGSKDFVGLCPFHEDKSDPNLIVSPAKGLWHCMACGAAGNAIQFVEKFDGVSFRHAFTLLNEGRAVESAAQCKRTTVPRLPCPLDLSASDEDLTIQVLDYYHERLTASDGVKARDYLVSRGLESPELVKRFRLGYADRTLGLRLPEKNRRSGAAIRERLTQLGFYRESGHEHLNGSLVIPVFDAAGKVGEVYGRKITQGLRKGTATHLYLPGPHRGVFNLEAFQHPELILCESLIDALSFWRHGMEAVTAIFGTEGFTEEIFEAIRRHKIESIRIAYDADEAGERAAKRDTERLQSIGIECHRIRFPWGEDANSFAKNLGGEALKRAVRQAEWIGAGASVVPKVAPTSLAASESLAAKTPRDGGVLDGGAAEARRGSPAGGPGDSNGEPAAKKESERLVGAQMDGPQGCPKGDPAGRRLGSQGVEPSPVADLVAVGDHHELTLGERRYRVGGLIKNAGLDALKVTLRLWSDEKAGQGSALFHIDQVDLCKDVDRRRFSERGAHECRLEAELIKRDLGKLLLACERAQDARLRAESEPAETLAVTVAPGERAEAEALLQAPDLIERLDAAFDAAGIVGEKTNRLAAYLTATSRLLGRPLAVIIQSTSAAGKTTLMEAVLSFFPPEEQVKYSAMTGQSLYYLGEKNLRHKILAIVEEEGAEKASYALKLLQSEGELTIASTGKDATTGRMKTEEYHVEGPVSIVLTTTSIDIDEELMNRCLILSVDESRAQTRAIHELQRQARTLEGLRLKKKRQRVLTLLQNAQRLLRPMEIVNPYAGQLTFTAERTRTRRDHEKYLTLIEAVTLLHQHQRRIEDDTEAGPHIKTTLEDITIANRLAPEVLGRSLDELPPQTRRLLEELKAMVAGECAQRKIDQDKCLFTRRQVRERLGWSEFQVRTHIQKLEELEYLARRHGRQGIGCLYELLIDCREPEGIAHVGLLDLDELRAEAQSKPEAAREAEPGPVPTPEEMAV